MNTLFSVILDAILVNLGTILAFLIRFGGVLPEFNFNAFKSIYLFMTLVNLTCIYIFELYTKRRKIFPLDIISRVSSAIVIASLISMAATYVFRDVASAFPTSVFLLSCVFNIIFVCGWRLLFNLSHQNKEERILMIGGDEEGKRLSRIINMGHLNRRIVKLLNKKEDKNNIIKTIDEFKITDVIIADSDFTHQEILDIILKCEERDVNLKCFRYLCYFSWKR